MLFLIWPIVALFVQFNSVYMEPLLQRNMNYNHYNDNYNYNYNSLDNFNEDISEYGDEKYEPLISAQFPSVDDAVYPSEFDNASPRNSLKAYFEKPVDIEYDDKRSIEGAAGTKLDVSKTDVDFNRNKKSQVLCKVQKKIHHHEEKGYEFLPKTYASYSCHMATPSDVMRAVGKTLEHEMCWVQANSCMTLSAKRYFLKRQTHGHLFDCWSQVEEREIGVGCECMEHSKFRLR